MSEEKVTILDVAQAAGVSAQTVSRVLNDRPDVSMETRLRVQKIIEQMGYSPNLFARNLSRGRSNSIGVIAYGLSYFGPSRVLIGIEGKINELNFSLALNLIDDFIPSQIDHILYELLSRRVEGIIWAVPAIEEYSDWLAEKFSKIQTPVVYINKGPTDSDFVVAMDNKLGGKLATAHLMAQGYRRIAIITGPSRWWETQERLAGWREVVTDAGYVNIDELIVEGDWNAPSGSAGLKTLFAKDPNIDAVFVSNDQMALGAMQASRELGKSIPQDLGIVGFDDIPEAAYFYPPLTTIRQGPKVIGALAVERISAIVEARQTGADPEPEILWSHPTLVVRVSSKRDEGIIG